MVRQIVAFVVAGVIALSCGGHSEFADVSAGVDAGDDLCGNGRLDPGELCDGDDLNNETCGSVTMLAMPAGTVSCTPQCTLNADDCREDAEDAGAGGSGAAGSGGTMGTAGTMGSGGLFGSGGTFGTGGTMGGLFGEGGTTGGGLFGEGGTTGGGLFGDGTADGGGLFGGLFGNDPDGGTSLFGGNFSGGGAPTGFGGFAPPDGG